MKKNEFEMLFGRGVVDFIGKSEIEKKLKAGKRLRVKLGIDPTGARLHIGRGVVLRKLRQFQDAGHQVVLIVGDFTGIVGDASDKDTERPMLTREKVKENMKEYLPQIGRMLDMDKCEVHYNSEWLAELDFYEISKLAQNFSVAEMLDRDNFSKRYKAGKRISLHEFLYPLMQGYDSVAIKSDIEMGGTDQLFNLLAGRTLQSAAEQDKQACLTMKLIEGTDGRKMSTSWGNVIYIDEAPNEMFGKAMSMADDVMLKYFEVYTDEDLEEMKDLIQKDPRNAKIRLAKDLVELFHNAEAAEVAEIDFVQKFVKKEIPDDISEYRCISPIDVIKLLTQTTGFAVSNSEARRLIQGGGVSINSQKITDPTEAITVTDGDVLKVGKRKFARLKV